MNCNSDFFSCMHSKFTKTTIKELPLYLYFPFGILNISVYESINITKIIYHSGQTCFSLVYVVVAYLPTKYVLGII